VETEKLNKYIFQIRSRNGVVVDNLKIHGLSSEDARRKLQKMYTKCEILSEQTAPIRHAGNMSYDDVINLIINQQ